MLSLGFLDWLGSSERLVRKSATPRTGVPETCKYSQRILELCVAFDRWGVNESQGGLDATSHPWHCLKSR